MDPTAETQTLLPNDNNGNIQDNLENETEDHIYSEKAQEILQDSIKAIKYVMICAVISDFTYSSTFSVWYLYASDFGDSTPISIVWLLYGGFFTICIAGLLYPCFSDSIGYDKTIILMLFVSTIGILGQSLASNFLILSSFFIISQVDTLAIALAYIAWILPHKYAVKYTSYLYSLMFIGYLSGPILAGLITYYVNFRTVFWINFGLNVMVLIMALKTILGKQHGLEDNQLHLDQELSDSDIDKDYIFPIILNEHIDHHQEKERSSLSNFYHSLTAFEWIQILNVIIQNGLIISLQALLITYYPIFIINYFDGNDLIAYFQLVMICSGFIVGNGLIPILINPEIKILFPFNNKYFILIISLIINIIILFFVYPLINDINLFWIANIFYGLFFGLTAMIQEIFILEMQPKGHIGKVNGVKGFIRHFAPAIAILIAGYLITKYDEYYIFYVSTGCLIISFILAIILVVAHLFNTKKNQKF